MQQVDTHRQTCDGLLLKWLVAAGLAWLDRNRERVNELNVFPVPDGDTGTNMFLTMKKANEEVFKLDEPHVGTIAEATARGALMGARGNSGVILSQLLQGFAVGLKGKDTFNVKEFADACSVAVEYAYKAVVEPVEGTILTVSREAVEAVQKAVETEGITLREALEVLVAEAQASLDRTPNLLPVLKEAGVVDSGGAGFFYIVEGMLRFLRGENIAAADGSRATQSDHWQDALVPDDEEGYGYDVQFLIHGQGMDVNAVRADIDAMGWSTLVVGDPKLIKVHVHVHNPAEPINYAIATLGAEIDDIVVENMQMQYHTYVEERTKRETANYNEVEGVAVITVVSGDGLRDIFLNDLRAAYVIHGGQTMNPSTEDFLNAIDKVPNDEIVLLPNNKNILMAANQAADLTRDKQVKVVPSRTVQQGIGAMVGFANASDNFDALVEDMRETMGEVVSVEITSATRDVTLDGVKVGEGQYIGIVDGKLTAAGDDIQAVLLSLLERFVAAGHELVTLYYGSDVSADDANTLADTLAEGFDDLEFEVVPGGQALYPYLISVE